MAEICLRVHHGLHSMIDKFKSMDPGSSLFQII